jgi:hypothetical protein
LIKRFFSFWRNTFCKGRVDHDLEEEISSYIELVAADKARDGMSREVAMQSAHREVEVWNR